MTDFLYELESGLIFQAWYDRYVHVFEKETNTLVDNDKVALLWRKMSNQVHYWQPCRIYKEIESKLYKIIEIL